MRARGAPEFLDWWVATFSSPVDRLRDGPLILDLLASRTFEDLQALATLFWAIRSDGVPDSNWDWIAYSDHSLVVFHRKIKFLEEERARLTRPDDVWSAILDRLASKIVRHEFVTWFEGRTALATDQGVAIEVTAPQLHIDWIERHYRASVDAAAAEVRPGAHVTFVAIAEVDRKQA